MRKSTVFITIILSNCINAFAFEGSDYPINAAPRWRNSYIRELNFLQQDTTVPVKIQLEKTSFDDMVILFISDTAKQTQEIGTIFNNDYSELMRFARENQLRPKKFLAWYYSTQPPWTMDVAVETDKMPSELKTPIKSRVEKGGEVVIAHMRGPYSELSKAYSQIDNWLKQNKRTARGNPFEVYLNDPITVKDPSEIQTDIYQPLQ
jgi:effector-binding domain-containing protein